MFHFLDFGIYRNSNSRLLRHLYRNDILSELHLNVHSFCAIGYKRPYSEGYLIVFADDFLNIESRRYQPLVEHRLRDNGYLQVYK